MTLSSLQREFVVSQPTKPTSPFEGQIWIDTSSGNTTKQYKNGVFKTISPDLSPVFDAISEVMESSAEARHKAGLSQVNADGGFFDAFVNQNKISNLNGAELSNNTVQLNSNIISTFESNRELGSPWSDWQDIDPEENLRLNTSNPISGTGSLEYVSGGQYQGDKTIVANRGSDIKPDTIKFKVELLALAPQDFSSFSIGFDDLAGERLGSIEFNDSQNLIEFRGDNFGTTIKNGFTDNKVYEFEIRNIDFANNTADILLNGSNKTGVSFQNQPVGFETISITNDTFDTGNNRSALFDDFIAGENRFSTPGTVTEQQFTFTDTQGNIFSPSKVGVFTEENLNGQSITYDLKDSTGTVVNTFNQGELNQLKSVNTTDTTFQIVANFSGNGTATPKLEFLDVRGSK